MCARRAGAEVGHASRVGAKLQKDSVPIRETDGLIVEVHPAPEKAISDGAQSLDLPQFTKMMQDLQPYISLWREGRTEVAAKAMA